MNTRLTEVCKYLAFDKQDLELLEQRDTSDVWWQFAIWLLVDPDRGFIRFTKPGSDQHDVITYVAQLYREDCKDLQTWKTAAHAAYTAFDSATTLAAAHAAHATHVAARAAYENADAAYGAAIASFHATASAASNASHGSAAARDNAYYAAFADAKDNMRKKLIKLINAAPPKETT